VQQLRELLQSGEAFSVDRDEEDGAIGITYDELLAHEYADRVEEYVVMLGALTGVDGAWHEDREVVVLRGSNLSVTVIETALQKFWSKVPRQPVRWAEETKIVERALVPVLKPVQFRKRGLIWNRTTTGGLVQVVHLYRTTYHSHFRPGLMLTVGVYCAEARKARHHGLAGRWVDGPDCHFSWEPVSDRPHYYENTWPLDEDSHSVGQEIADRVQEKFLPDLTRLQTPTDVVDFVPVVPLAYRRFNVFDRITFLVMAGRLDEARDRLQAQFDQNDQTRTTCLLLAGHLGLTLAQVPQPRAPG
jgi:hypothetical protein